MDIQSAFRNVISVEAKALEHLAEAVDESAVRAVKLLQQCAGKVVVIGMGKCGHVGQKIAATLASTGMPAQFVHPAEAIHGDLGYLQESDVVLLLSNSGETAEITELLPHLKQRGHRLLAITGRASSTLGTACDVVLPIAIDEEGDPFNLAPMASTTAMLALGDALASVLMQVNEFTHEAYSQLHPGGSLGQQLLSQVESLMHHGAFLPLCTSDTLLRDALVVITSKRLGTVFVVDEGQQLLGLISDGDVRRIFQVESEPLDRPVTDFMVPFPKTTHPKALSVDALRKMEKSLITCLPVVDDCKVVVGALHIHDLVRAGIGDFPDFLNER